MIKLLPILYFLVTPAIANASEITIHNASTQVKNGLLMLTVEANLPLTVETDLPLADEVIDALKSGVSIVFELEVRLVKTRKYWLDKTVFSTRRRYAVAHHALSERFVVTDLITGQARTFNSIKLMLASAGKLEDIPIADENIAKPGLKGAARLYLDIGALPSPMLPLAYFSPGWHISSEWYEWKILP